MNQKELANILNTLAVDAYLIYDFRGSNHVGRGVLGFDVHTTRRWLALITKDGSVHFIIPKIEESLFSNVVAEKKHIFTTYLDFQEILKTVLSGCKTVALDYSPENNIAVLDVIPAGFMELIKKLVPEVKLVPAAEISQNLASIWGTKGLDSHRQAAKLLKTIADEAMEFVSKSLKDGKAVRDLDVEKLIIKRYGENNLLEDHGNICIVSTNERASNPHYFPTEEENYPITQNSVILFDMWAKLDQPGSIYGDITLMGWVGPDPVPQKVQEVWEVVKGGRDIGIQFIKDNISKGVQGFEVDRVVRDFIDSKGYGDYFVHRTGHSIDTNTHGSGTNNDDFESKDTREIIPDTGFSIEPGVYLPEFGVRSEIDMYIHSDKEAEVTTYLQEELFIL